MNKSFTIGVIMVAVSSGTVWSQAKSKGAAHKSKQTKNTGGTMSNLTLPIVCKLTPAEVQQRRTQVLHKLKAEVKEQKSLPNGYAFRLEGNAQRLEDAMQLLRLERDCCSFLTIKLTAEPNEGPLWLEITGPEGTKTFIKEEMGLAS